MTYLLLLIHISLSVSFSLPSLSGRCVVCQQILTLNGFMQEDKFDDFYDSCLLKLRTTNWLQIISESFSFLKHFYTVAMQN